MTRTGVVLGVSGQIGTAVARRMLAEGWIVRGLHDTARALPAELAPVEVSVGDRNDDDTLVGLLADGADGVVDTIAYTSQHAHQLLAHAESIGALAVVSSIAVYADDEGRSIGDGIPRWPQPIDERQSLVPATDETYGGGKVLLENILLEANRLPVSLLRPAAVCGPGSGHLREWWFVKRVLDRRTIVPLKYRGLSRFHPSSTANIASLAVHCLGLTGSRILNAADPDCPTVSEIADYVAGATGHDWEVFPLPEEHSTGPVGETPWTQPDPIVLDTSAALATGYRPPTTYAAALPTLVEAALAETANRDWREVYPGLAAYAEGMFDYAAEDDFVARLTS
jgi:nucleoside-diphosphate-sugar epimerase